MSAQPTPAEHVSPTPLDNPRPPISAKTFALKPVNLARLKADFRAACDRRGVDPATGSTDTQAAYFNSSFHRTTIAAEESRRTYHARMSKLVYARRDATLPLFDGRPSKTLLFDNGRGAVDSIKVDMRALRNWWVDADLLEQGTPRLSEFAQVDLLLGLIRMNGYIVAPNDTEFEAVDRLLTQAEADESASRRRREDIQIVPVETIVAGVMRDLLREIMREQWEEVRAMIPLKQLHARQHKTNAILTCQ